MNITFENSYVEDLVGCTTPAVIAPFPSPYIVKFNDALGAELGFSSADFSAEFILGGAPIEGATLAAMAYSGHQFGHFSPSLGDGRALLLGEIIDTNGARKDIHLKGSGPTVYSRNGDGKAALAPMLREYMISESLHALSCPTTRSLAVFGTGEHIWRDTGAKPGAVLARVAASHLRVGTFQYFHARGEKEVVQKLADYAIKRHYPQIQASDNPYLEFLQNVIDRQAMLIARWMNMGFVHGVMNTDNMAISGEAIDFGPCAFLDGFDFNACFSSIDRNGRYAFGNQPSMAQWNLSRFAECLIPHLDDDNEVAKIIAQNAVEGFQARYHSYWMNGLLAKIGIDEPDESDLELGYCLLDIFQKHNVDFTLFFRNLAATISGSGTVLTLFEDRAEISKWVDGWHERVQGINVEDKMNAINPLYIPRNHLLEAALYKAELDNDCSDFDALLNRVTNPYIEVDGFEIYSQPAPKDQPPFRSFCGT